MTTTQNNNDEEKNIDDTIIEEESVTYEDETDSDSIESKLKKVKSELKKCQAEKQEYLDGWQRSKADYINLTKRAEQEKDSLRKYAEEDLILEMLSVVDNFEMAFRDKTAWNNAPENWRIGVEFIYSQLMRVLENHGVQAIDPLGQKFDPELHHSTEMISVETEEKDGIVIEVLQKGYKLKDKNIRVASVKVGEFTKN